MLNLVAGWKLVFSGDPQDLTASSSSCLFWSGRGRSRTSWCRLIGSCFGYAASSRRRFAGTAAWSVVCAVSGSARCSSAPNEPVTRPCSSAERPLRVDLLDLNTDTQVYTAAAFSNQLDSHQRNLSIVYKTLSLWDYYYYYHITIINNNYYCLCLEWHFKWY